MENPKVADDSSTSSSRGTREEGQHTPTTTSRKVSQSARDTLIISQYTERLWPLQRIGNEHGLSAAGVRSILHRHNVPVRSPGVRSSFNQVLSPLHRTLASNIAYFTDLKGVQLPLGFRKLEKLRSGVAEITLTELLRLAQHLGIEVADLLKKDPYVASY